MPRAVAVKDRLRSGALRNGSSLLSSLEVFTVHAELEADASPPYLLPGPGPTQSTVKVVSHMAAKLALRQQLFIKEYLVDLNATQAAIRAGYSPKTANEQAARLLARDEVKAAVHAAMQERSDRLDITADRVLQELAVIGFARLGDYVTFDKDGVTMKGSSEVDTRALAEVSKRSNNQGTTVTVKLHDKVAALGKLGQHLGLFRDKVELTGKDGGPIQVERKILPRDQVLKRARELGLLPADPDGGQGE